jgi:ABC-type multidrug transport system ATPase subunit
MDPGARHALWEVVRSELLGGGAPGAPGARSVVLTSHSMEECEAVCGRVGILAAGRLRCLGSVAALKARYAQGYRLEMRCAPGASAAATALVVRCAPGARLEDVDPAAGHLAFTLPRAGLDLPALIERVEGVEGRGCVEEWAVGEATLEQVFLGLARGGGGGGGGGGGEAPAEVV